MTPDPADSLFPRERQELAPGAVHVPDWLTLEEQQRLVVAARDWARGPAPMQHITLPGGGVMSVQSVSLGWYWHGYRYQRTAVDQGNAPIEPFPDWLGDLGRRAVAAAYEDPAAGAAYRPDAALVNFYDEQAKMGMHQDKVEQVSEPVVSLSIGASCLFRFGNTETRNQPYRDIELRSGDLFVFGGPSRFAFHGVTRGLLPGTDRPDTGLARGRLNLTLRVTGLD